MIKSPKLMLGLLKTNYYHPIANDWIICASALRRIFHLPKSAVAIQLQAWVNPGPNRTKVKFNYADNAICINNQWYCMLKETMQCIEPLSKGYTTLYIVLYYWS